MLLPGIDSTGVVSVDASYVAVRAWATVSARSSASGGSSGRGLLRGAISLASSLMRPTLTVPKGVLS